MIAVCIGVACALLWCAWLAHDRYEEIGAVLFVLLAVAIIAMGVTA